jgi:group I intron endonuclease
MYIYLIDYNYNNWFYIGKTSNSLKKRYQSHKGVLKTSSTLNHKVWNKSIGLGNIPEIILLEETNEIDINELEMFYISYFKFIGVKLTNLTDGGEGVKGLIFTQEHKNKISINRKGKNLGPNPELSIILKGIPKPKPINFGVGRKHSIETKQKIKLSNKGKHSNTIRSKPIYQIDKKTNLVLNTFNSVSDAAKFLKPNKFNSMRSSIESAANDKNIKQNSAGGYKWKYIN